MEKRKRKIELSRKVSENTATVEESEELKTILNEFSQKYFEACPVCGGSFTLSITVADLFVCPNCECQLTRKSYDCIPHQPHEIDLTLTRNQLLGEFFTRNIPQGCEVCFCGELYPASYSCCPNMLVLAIEMTLSAESNSSNPAIVFLRQNNTTLINSLRGKFGALWDTAALNQLSSISDQLCEPEALREIIADLELN